MDRGEAQAQASARWMMAAGVAAAVALLTGVVLFREFHGGLLTGLLPWDDCAIFDQATARLTLIARSGSLFEMALQAKSLALHGPVADLQTILGLLISGGDPWGPYALSGVLIFGATALVADTILRRHGALMAIAVVTLLLFQPLTLYSLMTLKADWKCGFFLACAMLLFAEAVARRDGKGWAAAYALLALAIVCKLTTFYLPVFAVLAVLGFRAAALDAWEAPDAWPRRVMAAIRELVGRWRLVLAGAAATCLPFVLLFAWGSVSNYNLLSYIRYAMSSVWSDGLGYGARALFYLPGANPTWGLLPFEAAALVVAGVALAGPGRRLRPVLSLLVVFALAAVLYVPLVVADGANIEFSGALVGVVLGAALVALSAVPRRFALPLLGALAPFVAFTPLGGVDDVLMKPQDAPPVSVADRLLSQRSYRQAVADVVRTSQTPEPEVRLLFEDSIAGFPNLSIEYFRRTGRILSVTRLNDIPSTPDRVGKAGQDEFFLTLVPSQPGVEPGFRLVHRFPASRDYLGSDRYVRELPGITLVGRYPWGHGELRLYRRPGI